MMDLHHPAVQSIALPLLIAFASTGMVRLVGGPGRGARLASASIPVALLISAASILGPPSWPPLGGMEKLVYLVAGGLGVGLMLDVKPLPPRLSLAPCIFWLGAAYAWLAWRQIDQTRTWWLLGGLGIAGLIVLLRTTDGHPLSLRAPMMFLVAALGLGGVALTSGSLAIAQLTFALAAAIGGFALWNWPRARYPFGAAALIGGGLPLLALAALTLLLTDAPPWALAPILFIFFADLVSRRLPPQGGTARRVLEPIYLALVAALPAALAISLALLAGQTDDLYYR